MQSIHSIVSSTLNPLLGRREMLAGAAALAASAAVPAQRVSESPRTGPAMLPRPFRIEVPDTKLNEIRQQVRVARLPRVIGQDGWDTGMNVAWLGRLKQHWLTRYNWRRAEAEYNRYPQFLAEVGAETLHFVHAKGRGPNPKPLLLVHGWPYTNLSFIPFIDRLTDPARFGGDAATALTVVAPALPGYGFGPLPRGRHGARSAAELFHKLMTETLGYRRYGYQGGDHGSVVGNWLAGLHPDALTGLHLNMMLVAPDAPKDDEERAFGEAAGAYLAAQQDYLRIQQNKPMMVGAALAASPFGTAAWIAEKYFAWTDNEGDLDRAVPMDRLLDEIMQYVVTDTIETSFWHYRGARDELGFRFHPGSRITTPTAGARFVKDYTFGRPPRSMAERSFNIVRFTDFPAGGHFPHIEQPEAFANDIRTFFASVAP